MLVRSLSYGLLGLLLALPTAAKVEFVSPFPSTVEGLAIPNSHQVGGPASRVYRGMSPDDRADDLFRFGFTDVLVFKEDHRGEVTSEIAELTAAGFSPSQIRTIPFHWDEMNSFQESCAQVVEGLALLEAVARSADRKLYFHCTVGEDRTGLLAGLHHMLQTGIDVETAFEQELCAHGYGSGNPQKPAVVTDAIRMTLNPIFFLVAEMIRDGRLARGRLDPRVCAGTTPPIGFVTRAQGRSCKASARYPVATTPRLFLRAAPYFDAECAARTKFDVAPAWTEELRQKESQFQKAWDEQGGRLIALAQAVTGRTFARHEYSVALTVCRWTPMGDPAFLVSVRPYLEGPARADERIRSPRPLNWFVAMTYHELLHSLVENLADPNFESPLLYKYRSETRGVRVHLHLMAIQARVNAELADPDLGLATSELYEFIGDDYIRAWTIVLTEGPDAFLAELRKFNRLP